MDRRRDRTGHDDRRLGWGAFAYIGVAAGAVLVATIVFTNFFGPSETSQTWRDRWAIGSVVLSAVLVVLLGREVARRVHRERAQARADAAIQRIGGLVEDLFVGRPLDAALHEIIELTSWGLPGTRASLFLAGDGGHLRLAAGDPIPGLDGAPAGQIVADGHRDGVAVSLTEDGRTVGAVVVRTQDGRRLRPADRAIARSVAERAATAVDRARLADSERRSRLSADHARRLLSLIAAASGVLAGALDEPEAAMSALTEVVVPDFADFCCIDLARADGSIERIASRDAETTTSAGLADLVRLHPGRTGALARIMSAGVAELTFVTPGAAPPANDVALLRALGLESWVIAPIRLHGLSLGTLTVGTRRGRRGLRPSDRKAIEEVAARCALTVEHGLLYGEAQRSAEDAERRSDIRARLIQATIVLSRALLPEALLHAVAEQTHHVFDASHVRVVLEREIPLVAEVGAPSLDTSQHSALLTTAAGDGIGRIRVSRATNEPITADDEAALKVLAQLASIAVQKASLYEDLTNREHRLTTLIGASPSAILELDRRGHVRHSNPAALALFPSSEGAVGPVVLPDELRERLADLAQRSAVGEASETEVTCRVADDATLELWVSTAPIRDAGGHLTGTLAVVTDFTRRKQLEAQLVASQRFEAIAGLAGGVAHDFNNLLTVIVGYSEMLQQKFGPDDPGAEELHAIWEAGSQAAVITNQLLALSKQPVVPAVVVRPAEAVADLVPMLRRLVGQLITVETTTTENGDAAIEIGPGQLEQLLLNLVINSRDAMPDGGAVRITTDVRDDGRGRELAISVSDTGTGMTPETLARCCEPFFTTKEHGRGTGLGLATVSTVVSRSGGTVDVVSAPGEGTTVTARFPLVEVEVEPRELEAPVSLGSALVVDDDDDVRRLTATMLSQRGWHVTTAADGHEALEHVDSGGTFDLLVTDVVMPGINGVELARLVSERQPGIATVLVTGFAGSDVLEHVTPDMTVVMKPFTPSELHGAATSALRAASGS